MLSRLPSGGKVTVSVAELIKSAEFLVDQAGNKKAVQLDFAVWQALLAWLEELEEIEDVQAVRQIEARIAAGQEPVYSHEDVWAEIDQLETQGELPA
jgi:hypothetical protein